MRRGDLVTVAAPGDYGKPRPAVVIQGDVFNEADSDSVILALMTGTLRDAPLLRLTVDPTSGHRVTGRSRCRWDGSMTYQMFPTSKSRTSEQPGGNRIDRQPRECSGTSTWAHQGERPFGRLDR